MPHIGWCKSSSMGHGASGQSVETHSIDPAGFRVQGLGCRI